MSILDVYFIKPKWWQRVWPLWRPMCPRCKTKMRIKVPTVAYDCETCCSKVFLKD